MSKAFDALVSEALDAERELRALSGGKPSIRGWVDACLKRGGLLYEDVEDVKERLGSDFLHTKMVDSGPYVRDIRKYILNGSIKEPPPAARIAKLYFAQRDGAIAELGGEARMLFALWAVAAEQVYQEKPELFGGIDDIDAHKARIAELEGKTRDLYAKFPTAWKHDDLWIGKITSDSAALICFAKAPGEVPIHHPRDAGERLVDWLLRQEGKARKGEEAEAA
jgi:hypothetical protein